MALSAPPSARKAEPLTWSSRGRPGRRRPERSPPARLRRHGGSRGPASRCARRACPPCRPCRPCARGRGDGVDPDASGGELGRPGLREQFHAAFDAPYAPPIRDGDVAAEALTDPADQQAVSWAPAEIPTEPVLCVRASPCRPVDERWGLALRDWSLVADCLLCPTAGHDARDRAPADDPPARHRRAGGPGRSGAGRRLDDVGDGIGPGDVDGMASSHLRHRGAGPL
jgi:hypothetical protein